MKTMYLPGYHHNGFLGTHALGKMMYDYTLQVPMNQRVLNSDMTHRVLKSKFTTSSPILLENRWNSNPYSLWKMGGNPAMINQDHFFHFFVTTNKASNNNKNQFQI